MKRQMTDSLLKLIKEKYITNMRVELVRMEDIQAPPIGTKGTVIAVDSLGTIHVKWDNDSTLGVVYGEDLCKLINEHFCPKCGKIFSNPPALSRLDNRTLICPDCGTCEALIAAGIINEE